MPKTKATTKAKPVKKPVTTKPKVKAVKAAPVETSTKEAKEPTKKQQVIDLLNRPEGVTMKHLMSEMKWLRHTTHAFFNSLRKKGMNIVTTKDSGQEPVYRIAA